MRTGLNAPRSRTGCQECRRRRKKCDQAKPACGLCQRAGKPCNYERELSWGGRPFGKSIFGQYSSNLTALKGEGSSKDFVYAPVATPASKGKAVEPNSRPGDSSTVSTPGPSGTPLSIGTPRPDGTPGPVGTPGPIDTPGKNATPALVGSPFPLPPPQPPEDDDDDVEDIKPSMDVVRFNTPPTLTVTRASIPFALDPTPDHAFLNAISTPWRGLLDHFVEVTSNSLSLHPSVRDLYATTLVPMALQRPSLLAGILQLAGHNKRSLGISQNEGDLDKLKTMSVSRLRQDLSDPSPNQEDFKLATILTLCTADIVAGGDRPRTWRTHLRGAAAMIAHSDAKITAPGHPLTDTQLFLRRWYLSMEANTLLGANNKGGLPHDYNTALRLSYDIGPSYIDEFLGFPPYLIRIFGDITRLSDQSNQQQQQQQQQQQSGPPPSSSSSSSSSTPGTVTESIAESEAAAAHRSQEAYKLLAELDQRLRAPPNDYIHPRTAPALTPAHRHDLLAVNAAFHHAAAVHAHRRILLTPTRSPLVQHRVKCIVELVATVRFSAGACPAVAFLLPLFTAGSEAVDAADQEAIAAALGIMRGTYGLGDVGSALRLLAEIWRRRAEGGEDGVDWESLAEELGLDLLCY